MFQFPGFAYPCGYTLAGGFPHSEIHGSKLVRSSPWLIAAYHVLHRLSAPRHPPNTLKALDRSHCRCPPDLSILRTRRSEKRPHTFTSSVRLNRHLTMTKPTAELPPRRSNEPSLHDVDEHAEAVPLWRRSRRNGYGRAMPRLHTKFLVEPDGIEPTTSCLQSTRSPN